MILNTLRNEKGLLTLDFVFASLLVFGLATVIFSFAMTLSVVEVVQYFSYTAARNYSLAHLDETRQEERGEFYFNRLATNPVFSSMTDLGWFSLEPVILGDFNSEFNPDPGFENFIGARAPLNAPILYKRIPMVGSTAQDPDAFRANIQSFLMREPTFDECQRFISGRAGAFQNLGYSQSDASEVALIMDNGC